jgi:predicted dinucleotide-binding enzyme
MKVSIIGAGNVGRAVAQSARRAGHDVTITSSSGDSAVAVANETGARAASSNVDAVRDADLVVLAVPGAALPDVEAELRDVVAGKPVVDTTNRPTPDPEGATGPTSIAEEIQAALQFVESIGFRPVDVGPLAVARTLEGMAWLNISLNRQGGSWQGGWKILEPGDTASKN